MGSAAGVVAQLTEDNALIKAVWDGEFWSNKVVALAAGIFFPKANISSAKTKIIYYNKVGGYIYSCYKLPVSVILVIGRSYSSYIFLVTFACCFL